jgi:hypothetical protein
MVIAPVPGISFEKGRTSQTKAIKGVDETDGIVFSSLVF